MKKLLLRTAYNFVRYVPEQIRALLSYLIHPEGEERRNRLERLANTDSLTGLANRRAYDLAKARAEDDPDTWFVVFDLDGFKALNDSSGHEAGDKALFIAATAIKLAALRYNSTRVFRYGGDEFIVLCEMGAMRKIAEDAQKEFAITAEEFGLTLSYGCGARFSIADKTMLTFKELRKAERERKCSAK